MNKSASVQPLSSDDVKEWLEEPDGRCCYPSCLPPAPGSMNEKLHQQWQALASGQHKTYNAATHRAVPIEPTQEICEWIQDSDGNWETDCDDMFVFETGSPADNHMHFCCYCGKKLAQKSYQPESVDD